jgi:hypothetical protein
MAEPPPPPIERRQSTQLTEFLYRGELGSQHSPDIQSLQSLRSLRSLRKLRTTSLPLSEFSFPSPDSNRHQSVRFTDLEPLEPPIKVPRGSLARTNDRTVLLQRRSTAAFLAAVDYANPDTGEVYVSVSGKHTSQSRSKEGHVLLPTTDLEAGVAPPKALPPADTSIQNLNTCCDVELGGRIWRRVLQSLICATRDDANVLRITRVLQFSIPFQTSYEAYLIGELIAALRSDTAHLAFALNVIFQNRNATRVLIRNMPRWDILFHQDQQLRHAIFYDAFGVTIGLIGFPASENFVNTRNFTVASIFRFILGEGHFVTRFLTGRQALITDNPNVTAQNLAAEGAGFETANRAQWGKKNRFLLLLLLNC